MNKPEKQQPLFANLVEQKDETLFRLFLLWITIYTVFSYQVVNKLFAKPEECDSSRQGSKFYQLDCLGKNNLVSSKIIVGKGKTNMRKVVYNKIPIIGGLLLSATILLILLVTTGESFVGEKIRV